MSLSTIGNGLPVSFEYMDAYNSIQNPSTLHASDTGLSRFFQRHLLQRAISQFKWKMPDYWAENYVLYCVYCWGYISVINTNKFGIIPQGCSLKGYNVMYQPRQAVISNPLLRGIVEPVIGKECEIIRLQPDYAGVWDLVSFYADMMALTAATAGSNIVASKLAYIYGSQNKAFSESFKKVFDEIASGQPAIVIDKQLLDENGRPTWFTFSNNLRSNYIAGDLLEDLKKWEKMFDTEIGIPVTNTEKKERLVSGEVNSNMLESYTRVELWLDTLKKCCDKVNAMFGDIISVDWRIDPKEMVQGDVEGSDNKNGT